MSRTDLPYSATPQFDTGPLSWVMVEIREALGRSRTALFEAGGREAEDQATALQHAKSHLHQAHGALQMVDVDGVVVLTELAEQVLDRFKAGTLKCNTDHVRTVAELYQALTEFLQELLEGEPLQPVRLFPWYREVQAMLGAERVHPADLFFPDLSPRAALSAAAPDAGAPDYTALRQRFERALLPYLKAPDAAAQMAQAAALQDAVAAVADAQQEPQARAFWLAQQAFAGMVAAGQLESGLYVKQLFGLINLQLRRQSQGNMALPDSLLRDALFFVAAADADSLPPLAQQLHHAYALERMVPRDYEARRYGQLDQEALARAREGMQQAQAAWRRLEQAGGDAALNDEFGQALAIVGAAGSKLGLPALATLMRQLADVANSAATVGRSEELGLEMATALLFAEHGLEQIRHLPDDFAAHADTIGARLQALLSGQTPPQPAQWQGSLARRMQQDDTVAALSTEMKTGLRQVEKVLDDYYADPARRAELAPLDGVLHQLQGALSLLDQDDAVRAAQHVRAEVQKLAAGQGDPAQEAKLLDQVAQNVGALGFFVDTLAQNPAGARERFSFDAGQGSFRAVPFRKMAGAESIPVLEDEVAPPATPVPPQQAPAMAPSDAQSEAGDAAIEAELLDIFIAEAQDVLAFVDATLAKPRAEAGSLDHLTMLRRSFHTLKGSGRMVGLNHFADAAGAVERTMNQWLAEERPASDALFALLEHAAAELGAWVGELVAAGASPRNGLALIAAAGRVQAGGAFALEAEAAAEPAPEPVSEPSAAEDAAHDADADAGVDTAAGGGEVAPPQESAAPRPAATVNGNVIDFPAATTPAAQPGEDNIKFVGRLAIPLPLYNIYLAETDEIVRLLARDFGEWRHEPRRPVSPEALQAAHTLAGTSATVGFKALRELAYALESTLLALSAPAPQLDHAQHDLLDFSVERVRQMLQSFAAADMPPEQPELIAALDKLRAELASPARTGAELDARLDSLLADSEGAELPQPVPGMAAHAMPAESPLEETQVPAPSAEDELAARLDALFTDTYHSLIASPPPAPQRAARPAAPAASAAASDDIDDLFASAFDDSFAPVAPLEASELAPLSEHAAGPASLPPEAPAAEPAALLEASSATPVETPTEAPTGAAAAPPAGAETGAAVDLDSEVEVLALPGAPAELATPAPGSFQDEIDADLLPVFLEEGADLLPQIGEALRTWQHNPADFSHAQMLQRVLHTVKGSARMAGAMRLGQHAHEIETHIENMVHAGSATPHAFEELLAHYDHALLLFEQLQDPAALQGAVVQPGAAVPDGAAPGALESTDPASDVAAKTPLVRVRADILDRLVNQAGEVSISRSRLENEVGSLRASLNDFSENLNRLRRQLREVEMQAETQIASRMSISGEREFDPLEFDRFTRLQELTRMMAESVNDVAAFHENLGRSVEAASGDLNQQARMTRELQRDLMRVRMVPFASISERLFRVARQSAKEVDKRVNLDIRGSAVDIDRSVLERMAAPFEHLLRNAIVHGVETRERRGAAGKEEIGELLIQVSQQGNEVVIEFSDDGAGLDLQRIRAKARSVGLLGETEEVSDAEAANLIFEPGFSTADTLTELAGRGVGMDIVRAEAQALGGRIDTMSESGKGARFTIHLPLTLAVTQVVLLSAGGRMYALPSVQVEQVLQMKDTALGEAQAKGELVLHGQHTALHYLPELLGGAAVRMPAQRSAPVLMLRNGSDKLALHVDEVLGNREVVIKNIGPQLARMPGIAGATVLGSGEIVLILNPLALVQHLAQHPELRAEYAEAAGSVAAGQGERPGCTVMVVDDSLTVRKVTQRLLEREGYQVVLAKDGVDALEQMQELRPDMMLVDIEMPRMDGFDLTRNVRGDARTRDIPIIMITSRSADKHRNYAMELGVNAYFGKPYQEAVLLSAIAGLLPAA
ncbi:hybrid sensor histidine kinase/response regulator [Pseudoduganella violacea]|uniref:Chemotaxis protein CheA n=1 Tax=Pseudoduganella violacea TaxID=1715466 RepID=A0A7W5FV19_9BURK|nr:Hpt domain-containing protein [Pseudoduganella violacea]MBB3120515.1 chemosensory pili system protein ChpA (sensor histidine kinase/response regulator) [Pseudoduganella violacea]